ncbi:uncharacterized protein LOC141881681 isoform X2 [Acropora palmata]|uniref:uncharacterized protein LOC141881681 isoform X2 n=1 Tax=Acropora palmata TaxID=6131 RepID=UPI003DA098F7
MDFTSISICLHFEMAVMTFLLCRLKTRRKYLLGKTVEDTCELILEWMKKGNSIILRLNFEEPGQIGWMFLLGASRESLATKEWLVGRDEGEFDPVPF